MDGAGTWHAVNHITHWMNVVLDRARSWQRNISRVWSPYAKLHELILRSWKPPALSCHSCWQDRIGSISNLDRAGQSQGNAWRSCTPCLNTLVTWCSGIFRPKPKRAATGASICADRETSYSMSPSKGEVFKKIPSGWVPSDMSWDPTFRNQS
jgi:hypothetical protein